MSDDGRSDSGEFGPSGYLPPRAANRARKIVLRERMGLGWPVASVAAGLVVLAAGAVFLLGGGAGGAGGPPGEPFVAVAPLDRVAEGDAAVVAVGADDILLVRPPGAVRVFAAPDQAVRWCGATDRIEGDDGAVWQLDGRRVGGDAASLRPLPARVHRGVIHAAPTRAREPRAPTDGDEAPGCRDA